MPELDEKREEAIVESVLFTMGKSVELRQLAAALGTDTAVSYTHLRAHET